MPHHAPPPRDPRSIITPDAFEVSPALLGLPLAAPSRRLAALLIDLAVVGAITLLTQSFALILGVVVAVLFIREGFKRTPVRGSVFGRAMRLSVGCLGVFIGLVTVVIWMAVGIGGGMGSGDRASSRDSEGTPVETSVGGLSALMALGQGLGDVARIQEATTEAEAQAATTDLARRTHDAGVAPDTVRLLLEEVLPDDAPWSDRKGAIVDRAMAAIVDVPADTTPGPAAQAVGIFEDSVVADTLRALSSRIADLSSTNEESQESLERLRRELREEREGGSLFSWLRDFVDELGFGFGWASLYLTVMLSWWKGQTVGKRLMKIRVVRLDGEPITWWVAFERAGGYAAGFATGLLGFAQVYWDANRQAIHDRIVGTVVVVEGGEKALDWKNAL